MITLDDETLDALAETFNLALGEASVQFAELVQQEIELSVPEVDIVPLKGLASALQRCHSACGPGTAPQPLCRIAQSFRSTQSDIRADAMLVFPEKASLEIVRQMLGSSDAAEHVTEIEQDALAEIGNIIINSCMNSLAHIYGREMLGSLPDVRTGRTDDLFRPRGLSSADDHPVLLARIDMRMSAQQMHGTVVFIMDAASLQVSLQQIRRFFGLDAVQP